MRIGTQQEMNTFFTFDSIPRKRMSFILITKNNASELEYAIQRAKEFITDADELLVIDGASNDNTKEVIKKHHQDIHIFLSEEDVCGAHATNKGVLLAQGKYTLLLSGDSVINKNALEQAIAVMDGNPAIDVLVCGGFSWYGRRAIPFYVPPGVRYGSRPEDPFRHKACGSGTIVRRSSFAKIGLHPVGWAADIAFIAQSIARGGVVKFLRVRLFEHTIDEASTTQKHAKRHAQHRLEAAREHCSFSFYVRYRIKEYAQRFSIFRCGRVYWNRFLKKIKGQPFKRQYIWDGGLS
ncbi:MAG: hypothetical protein COU47_00775 [Candidatus Niyogibacteria bacterium CG10_big_fil_rev_8_21_14_0_10_46_36]|uniref:Glycosyltransferase 2-like domain-containing protein n=1 Tax=Candidatus Niyogibacteria bacterium CG10_big_fil_rev_8_21_14_0_10_46_36 TaxID=1974726 RepID=A0A2H0TEI0_9BACT|nr:MAG: hypothetical protein COU47_00775 [Candidatus Niyogibacteria bacterium CG10_big_fil_rev_8_21_14_0_10_46_36]